jgi:hypothetical protein
MLDTARGTNPYTQALTAIVFRYILLLRGIFELMRYNRLSIKARVIPEIYFSALLSYDSDAGERSINHGTYPRDLRSYCSIEG